MNAAARSTSERTPRGAPALIGIDWGTTNRRGYLIDAEGRCLAEHEDGDGMLAARGRFGAALQAMRAALGVAEAPLPAILSGMVGSASGWIEAPYLDLAVALTHLRAHLVAVPGAPEVAIVPGYCQRGPAAVDVMRGEETQLLGALALGDDPNHGDGWCVLPGTHSKWVRVQGGAIQEFATFMTGELFALLSQHGTLAAASTADAPAEPQAFDAGLRAAMDGAVLSNALFGCRARVVSGAMPAAHARSYLSGLLIGAEWQEVRRRHAGRLPARITLIGSAALAGHYMTAGAAFGVEVVRLDPRAVYLAALAALRAPA
ncbi:MAG: 2-dehydro-3-deoxygalactonokinase [Pseudomonadota bacterium]